MISGSAKTTVKGQERVAKLMEAVSKYPGAHVTVGVHENAGSYAGGQDVVEVALFNEFGTEKIPSRSFVRSTIDERTSDINQFRESLIGQIVDGKMDIPKALAALGFKIQVLIQNKIKSNVPPPNAESTLKKKANDGVPPRTLINTGLLLRSVTYKVKLK